MFRDQQQEGQPGLKSIPTQSWYPPSVLRPNSSLQSRASIPSTSTSSELLKPGKSNCESGLSPTSQSATRVLSINYSADKFPPLKDKSAEELKKLLMDKTAYYEFLHTLDDVKSLDILLQKELWRSNIDLAKQNLHGESQIAELRNQCAIIRTMELAAAQENLDKAQEKKRNLMEEFSVTALASKLQEAAEQVDEESELLQQQFLAGQIALTEYLSKYRKLRVSYHKRVLIRLAASRTI